MMIKKKKLGEKCSKLRDPSVITIFLQACASYAREPRHVGGVGRKIDQVDGDRLWSMDRVWISVAAELFPELSGKTCGFWKRVTRPPPASSSSLPDHASSDIDGS